MKKWFDHKHQAFYLSCLIFLPLFVFAVFNDIFKVEIKGEDKISLVMSQFIAQGQVVQSANNPIPAPEPPQPVKKKEPEKKPKPKPKKIKPEKIVRDDRAKKFKKIEKEEPTPPQSTPIGGAQVNTNQPTQIGTLAFGKNDNPFLREVKRAIDEAAREAYPRQARRMRLTGEVLLEFVWLHSKELKDIKIIKSSGHDILDKNIYKIIAEASKKFPQYKKDVRIQMPIAYTLED